jgi:hypothetical protein
MSTYYGIRGASQKWPLQIKFSSEIHFIIRHFFFETGSMPIQTTKYAPMTQYFNTCIRLHETLPVNSLPSASLEIGTK